MFCAPRIAVFRAWLLLSFIVGSWVFLPAGRTQDCPPPDACGQWSCYTGIMDHRWCRTIDYYFSDSVPDVLKQAVSWAVGEWNFETTNGEVIPVRFGGIGDELFITMDYVDGPGDTGGYAACVIRSGDVCRHAIMNFDIEENWSTMSTNEIHMIALHELGHVLGLNHVPCHDANCQNLLMYPCAHSNAYIDWSAHVSLQCIYGDLVESPCNQLIKWLLHAILDAPAEVTLKRGECRGCVRCLPALHGDGQNQLQVPIVTELAVSASGAPFVIFANINESQWVNNTYIHVFDESYENAIIRARGYNGNILVSEAYTYPPINIEPVIGVEETGPALGRVIRVAPNPTNGSVDILYVGRPEGAGRILICDVRGRVIRELRAIIDWQHGGFRSHWDGYDTSGHPVASGVYLAVGRQGDELTVARFAVKR